MSMWTYRVEDSKHYKGPDHLERLIPSVFGIYQKTIFVIKSPDGQDRCFRETREGAMAFCQNANKKGLRLTSSRTNELP